MRGVFLGVLILLFMVGCASATYGLDWPTVTTDATFKDRFGASNVVLNNVMYSMAGAAGNRAIRTGNPPRFTPVLLSPETSFGEETGK